MSRARSPILALEIRIRSGEHGDIMDRWRSGRLFVEAKGSRKQLPHGMVADSIKAAARLGIKLTETEIQRRIRLATVYDSEAKVRQAMTDFGTWTEIIRRGFPPVELAEPELPLDVDEIADAWRPEQLTIPGVPDAIKLRGRPALPLAEATVRDFRAYCEQSAEMTASFAKRDALLREALEAMEDGSNGDDDANALDAWKAGVGLDEVTE